MIDAKNEWRLYAAVDSFYEHWGFTLSPKSSRLNLEIAALKTAANDMLLRPVFKLYLDIQVLQARAFRAYIREDSSLTNYPWTNAE
jgi:hypothetical protein